MDKISSIVVGIDFSASAKAALEQAVRIGARSAARVQVVHVIDTLVVVELQEALSPMVQGMQESLIDDAKEAWEKFAPDMPGKAGMDFRVAVNNQLAELLARVAEQKAELLILGVRGESGSSGVGGLAADAVRRCPVMTMLVREGQAGPFTNIVVAVDFSATSRRAVEAGALIAAQDGGVLNIVHIFNAPWTRFHYRAPTAATSPEFQQQFRAGLLKRLEEFCVFKDPAVARVKPKFHMVEGTGHGAGITEFARKTNADLVVLGTRGRTNLRDVLIGSTAERVVRDAPCSILAVKPEV